MNEKPNELLYESFIAATFVESIDNNDHRDGLFNGQDRINNKFLDLIIQTLEGNRCIACESMLHRQLYRRKELSKLMGKSGEKLGGITAI